MFQRIPAGSSNTTIPHFLGGGDMRRLMSILVLVLMAMALPAIPASAEGLTVEVEESYQNPGGIISIDGMADPLANVSLVVTSSFGETILNTTIQADREGYFSLSLTLEVNATPGVYRVEVAAEGEIAEDRFIVVLLSLDALAERLIDIANRCRAHLEELIQRLNASGVEIPEEALKSYEEGVDALEKAIDAFEEGDMDTAIEYAMEALKHFREALQHLSQYTTGVVAEDVAEKLRGLKRAIDRAYRFLERVEELAKRLEEEGYDVSEVWSLLEEAKRHLMEAERLLEEGDIDGAARELASARGLLGRAWAYLHGLMTPVRERRIERFLNHTKRRIRVLLVRVEALRDMVSAEKVDRCLRRLEGVEERLESVWSRVEERELGRAVDELEEASQELDDALEEVEGGYSRLLKEMDRVQARMLTLNATVKALRIMGVNETEVELELEKAEKELESMEKRLTSGKTKIKEAVKRMESYKSEMAKYVERLKEKVESWRKPSTTSQNRR